MYYKNRHHNDENDDFELARANAARDAFGRCDDEEEEEEEEDIDEVFVDGYVYIPVNSENGSRKRCIKKRFRGTIRLS